MMFRLRFGPTLDTEIRQQAQGVGDMSSVGRQGMISVRPGVEKDVYFHVISAACMFVIVFSYSLEDDLIAIRRECGDLGTTTGLAGAPAKRRCPTYTKTQTTSANPDVCRMKVPEGPPLRSNTGEYVSSFKYIAT
jgi:hypothetical protein